MSEKRDLAADLEICKAATNGPWEWVENKYRGAYSSIVGKDGVEVLFPNHCNDGDDGDAWFEDFPSEEDAKFIAVAREGWPHAIKRTMAAEKKLEALDGILAEEQIERSRLRAENARLKAVIKAAKKWAANEEQCGGKLFDEFIEKLYAVPDKKEVS